MEETTKVKKTVTDIVYDNADEIISFTALMAMYGLGIAVGRKIMKIEFGSALQAIGRVEPEFLPMLERGVNTLSGKK